MITDQRIRYLLLKNNSLLVPKYGQYGAQRSANQQKINYIYIYSYMQSY